PDRLAGRILQQGDILSLVEKAQSTVDEKEAERLAKKVQSKKGMDLGDFLNAMRQMQKMGPLKNVLGMLPGIKPAMLQAVKLDDKKLKHVEAIVLLGTYNPKGATAADKVQIDAEKARQWIAKGATPSDTVQSLLKQAGVFQTTKA